MSTHVPPLICWLTLTVIDPAAEEMVHGALRNAGQEIGHPRAGMSALRTRRHIFFVPHFRFFPLVATGSYLYSSLPSDLLVGELTETQKKVFLWHCV